MNQKYRDKLSSCLRKTGEWCDCHSACLYWGQKLLTWSRNHYERPVLDLLWDKSGLYDKYVPTFSFLISNVRILLIIEKVPSRVRWGCTMGAQIRKQKYNYQEK